MGRKGTCKLKMEQVMWPDLQTAVFQRSKCDHFSNTRLMKLKKKLNYACYHKKFIEPLLQEYLNNGEFENV